MSLNQSSKKILIVFGTRPEAIKLAPIIKELGKNSYFKIKICIFRQHKEMLDQVLKTFDIKPDFDLGISINDKDLFGQNLNIFRRIKTLIQSGLGFLRYLFILKREKPDLLIVQGDTSTVFLAAFLAYLFKINIAHIEAGLRTYDKYAPFPEEMNRQLLGRLADIHFAPTEGAKKNLLNESVPSEKIHVVGNTEVDALLWITDKHKNKLIEKELLISLQKIHGLNLNHNKKIILVTAHRRENFGEGLRNIYAALKEIADRRDDVVLVYPVHPNPNVHQVAYSILSNQDNVFLTSPIAYELFIFLMSRAYLILTDSGGIQEAAPSLNKPVLVMREKTERVEGIDIGASKLVGTDKDMIVDSALELLDNSEAYNSMIGKTNPYGDGKAAEKIVGAIAEYLET